MADVMEETYRLVRDGWERQRAGILQRSGVEGAPEGSGAFHRWAREQDAEIQARLHAAGWLDIELHKDCPNCLPGGRH